MTTITVSEEDFKTIHNALCDLRGVERRLNDLINESMATKLTKIVERFEQGLKSAYAQDNDAFDRKHDYYNRFRTDNELNAIWSVFSLQEHGFLKNHPYEGIDTLVYDGFTTPIEGTTWGDLYRAADVVIKQSEDVYHIFIEGFYVKDDKLHIILGS
jgi:hypothetical protein